MLFNSLEFAIFLPLVFAAYWLLQDQLKAQNVLIVLVSYIFYGWWDARFVSLIVFSSLVDYVIGIAIPIQPSRRRQKALLGLSIAVNIGLLGTFKYFDFFAESFVEVASLFGVHPSIVFLDLILPVGISFYTFQTLSYTIDVFRGKIPRCNDLIAFLAYVSFFPQLVAGPIERATHLLPQFLRKRDFHPDRATLGLQLILWGLFKKVVVADRCAIYVDRVFAEHASFSAVPLWIGAVLFSLQIYCDFSGYSSIARGTSRLLGFELMENFRTPYFARDIAEFWRRWHISLNTWFRDYIYIPLGGNRGRRSRAALNTLVVFLISGLWHGASWNFIVWGLVNAALFMPLLLLGRNRIHIGEVADGAKFASAMDTFRMARTFTMVTVVWVLFRSQSIAEAFTFLKGMFVPALPSAAEIRRVIPEGGGRLALLAATIVFMIGVEWLQRGEDSPLQLPLRTPWRWATWSIVAACIPMFGAFEHRDFIYFQF